MAWHLTVTQDFGPYKKGDGISDPAEVARLLDSEHQVHVVKVPLGTHDLVEPLEPQQPSPAASIQE